MKTFIYALTDPRNQATPMYIGKSNNVKDRLACHVASARHANHNKQNRLVWIRNLLAEGLAPSFLILEECEFEVWKEREQFHIAKWRALNPLLTNMAKGGDDYHKTSTREEQSRKAKEAAARLTPEQKSDRSRKAIQSRRDKGLPVGGAMMSIEDRLKSAQKANATKKARGNNGMTPETVAQRSRNFQATMERKRNARLAASPQ